MLAGKKTYIVAALLAVLVFARFSGFVDQSTFEILAALFGAGGMASLRNSIK